MIWLFRFAVVLASASGLFAGIPLVRTTNVSINLPSDPPLAGYSVTNALAGLRFDQPVGIVSAAGETNRLFVVERTGQVVVITNLAAPTRTVFLDLRATVSLNFWEEGLLGMAFHPNFASNGYFYIYRTLVTSSPASGFGFHNQLSRFSVSPDDPNRATTNSELRIIAQLDGHGHHNAGDIRFGPEGYLYLTLGDDGPAGDDLSPNRQAIDRGLFGGVIRIDVDMRSGNLLPNPHPSVTTNYLIPADNPFVGMTEYQGIAVDPARVRTEFYAIGFRNPWRMVFHPRTGDLIVGDVGGGAWEEVNVVSSGANYGWPYMEAFAPIAIEQAPLGFTSVAPAIHYGHGSDTNSGYCVIGGVFYEGTRYPDLSGSYIFGDFRRGHIWRATFDEGTHTLSSNYVRLTASPDLTAFGTDPSNGDVLVANIGSGEILRLVYTSDLSAPAFPATLADTGAFVDLSALTPAPGVIPYSIANPFWSDNAIKSRWFQMPDAESRIGFSAQGNWLFPTGMIWIKHFEIELTNGLPESRRRLETRFLVKQSESVYGLTYKWDAAQTNAYLVTEQGEDESLEIWNSGLVRTQRWHYPSRAECRSCHSDAGGQALGFNTAQLNYVPSGGIETDNRLLRLSLAGYLNTNLTEVASLRSMVRLRQEEESLYDRAKSYFGANCSFCHYSGSLNAFWDARYLTRLQDMGLTNGGRGLVQPGSIADSVLIGRLTDTGPFRMPPIGSSVHDTNAIEVLRRWIASFPQAPWSANDIGEANRDGSSEFESGTTRVTGAGLGLVGTGDSLHFLHQPASGNILATVKLDGHRGALAHRGGLMFRESTNATAAAAWVGFEGDQSVFFAFRPSDEVSADGWSAAFVETDRWLQLERTRSQIVARVSVDGSEWADWGVIDVFTSDDILVGLASSSGSTSAANPARFSQFSVATVSLEVFAGATNPVAPELVELSASVHTFGTEASKVEFFTGTTKIGEDTLPPFDLVWPDAPAGVHVFSARLTTTDGLVLWSETWELTVGFPESLASLVATNASPGGDWESRFGGEAFDLAGIVRNVPESIHLAVSNAVPLIRENPSGDIRALVRPGGATRTAAEWSSSNSVWVYVELPDGVWHSLTLYVVDWERAGRSQLIRVHDQELGDVLSETVVSGLGDGNYFTWKVRGRVAVEVRSLDGGNAVVSGVFLDSFADSPPAVAIDSPAGGVVHDLPHPLPVIVAASDSDGIVVSVELFVDGSSFGVLSNAPFAFSVEGLAPGEHQIRARAYDSEGSRTDSASTSILVRRPIASAVRRGIDRTTQGDWMGRYGSDGYLIVNHATNLPASAAVVLSGAQSVTWGEPDLSVRRALLQTNGTSRIASSLYEFLAFDVTTSFDDGRQWLLSLYLLDWDRASWQTRLRLRAEDGSVLDEVDVTEFGDGAWVSWTVRGQVRIEAETLFGFSVIGGIFLDRVAAVPPTVRFQSPVPNALIALPTNVFVHAVPIPGAAEVDRVEFFRNGVKFAQSDQVPFHVRWQPPYQGVHELIARAIDVSGGIADSPPLTVTAVLPVVSNEVRFVSVDTRTMGNWLGVYGADGYAVLADSTNLPPFVSVAPTNATGYVWDLLPTSTNALQRSDRDSRIAAAWYADDEYRVTFECRDGRWHRLAGYFLDWDTTNRAQELVFRDPLSYAVLDQRLLTNFSDGVYMQWDIRGTVELQLRSVSGEVVASGFFFDPVPPATAWRLSLFDAAERDNPALSADDADSDGDGLPNLIEYKLGRNPKVAEQTPGYDLAILPGELQVTCHVAPLTDDVILDLTVSTNLVNWVSGEAAGVVAIRVVEAASDRVTFRVPISGETGSGTFLRLRALPATPAP